MSQIMKTLLNRMGFGNIYQASDGADALKIFKSTALDVILVDWEMPYLNGIDFVRMVRTSTDSPNPYIPIIMVSGYSELSRIVEARDAGVNEFIVKPISASLVYSRLATIIEKPRPYVHAKPFFGPCRRRKAMENFQGPDRRANAA